MSLPAHCNGCGCNKKLHHGSRPERFCDYIGVTTHRRGMPVEACTKRMTPKQAKAMVKARYGYRTKADKLIDKMLKGELPCTSPMPRT